MNFIDTHAHLFLEEFAADLPEVMARACEAGITHIFMPNIDASTIEPLLQTCDTYQGYCYPMAGLHPTSEAADWPEQLRVVRRELTSGRPYVAIGEIGIDLYWDRTYLEEQKAVFRQQVEWALECSLPIVIHCREAFAEIMEQLRPYREAPLTGIFHCFSGGDAEAQQILDFPGMLIGVNGILTFKKSPLPDVLRSVPLERMVIETDCPYLAPVPYRGRRNESAYAKSTLFKLAEVCSVSPEKVAKITSENALKVFGMLK